MLYLQLQNGDFVALRDRYDSTHDMLMAFNTAGEMHWIKPVAQYSSTPLYALADGSMVYREGYSPNQQLVTLDAGGNELSRIADPGTVQSWTGSIYKKGSTIDFEEPPSEPASTFAAEAGGNPSGDPSLPTTAYPSLGAAYRSEIARLAENYVGNSTKWNEQTRGGVTCNLFVKEVLNEASLNTLQTVSAPVRPNLKPWELTSTHPFLAQDWANPGVKDKCWKMVSAGPDSALPGDVLATGFPANGPDGTGHVGLIVPPDSGTPNYRDVSAADVPPYWWTDQQKQSFIPGTITLTDYGFRLPGYDPANPSANQGLKRDSNVRRFSCY